MTWQQITNQLATDLSQDLHELWIKPLNCKRFDDEVVELCGPDRFFCSWIADHYLTEIKRALAAYGKTEAKIVFSVNQGKMKMPDAQQSLLVAPKEQLCLPTINKSPSFCRTLNPRYVFDEFVVGSSNEMAYAACHALACGDKSLGQCLYISAGTGLGKSHLTHAVAHHILGVNPRTRLNYLTAQQLTSDMVRSIQNKSMDAFKERYQGSDVLLMEDMQSLTGRVKTQEELASCLDVLLESGKTVIFTGAYAPRDIEALSPGVQSRLSCGLVTEISQPDITTRIRIVHQKAAHINLVLTEELAGIVAEKIKGDVRQINSVIIGLKAKSNLRKIDPDRDMVNEVIANLIGQHQNLTPEAIRDFVAAQFKLSGEDLSSKSRKKTFAFPRQVSMYFSRKYTEKGLSEIGKAFNRDHSTVVHSIRVVTEAMNEQSSVRGQVELLDKKFNSRFLNC
ncbi:MAG: chromosomal replication initiator protein DnaA [Desulfobulbaceae bacterium]|nr:chromosomal replication initiator protein DnaA [Desulfobulbaceae bacterium]